MLLPANHGIHRHVLAFRLTNCLFPIPASQPTVTEHFQSLLYRSGTVFRSISHLLHHFLSSALAWRHTSSNSVTNNYCCGACRRKWQLTDTDLCPCGETQTMSHIVESCPDKTEWQLISATLCGWRRCFVVDQLWLMKCIREEEYCCCARKVTLSFMDTLIALTYSYSRQYFHNLLIYRLCQGGSYAISATYSYSRQYFHNLLIYRLCQGGSYAISAVCLSFYQSFCLSVSRITAKVIIRFDWNLVLWLDLPIRRTGDDLVPDMDSKSPFHFPHQCRMEGFQEINISHTVTGWFLQHSAKWPMPTR